MIKSFFFNVLCKLRRARDGWKGHIRDENVQYSMIDNVYSQLNSKYKIVSLKCFCVPKRANENKNSEERKQEKLNVKNKEKEKKSWAQLSSFRRSLFEWKINQVVFFTIIKFRFCSAIFVSIHFCFFRTKESIYDLETKCGASTVTWEFLMLMEIVLRLWLFFNR